MSSYEDQPLPIEGLPEATEVNDNLPLSPELKAHWERVQSDAWRKYECATRMLGGAGVQQEIHSPMSREAAAYNKFGVNAVTSTSTKKTDRYPNPSDAFARVPDTANID